jgi:hypothetical protein
MRNCVWIATLVVGTFFMTAQRAAADPPSLTFGTQVVHTSEISACVSFAQTAMRQLGVDRTWSIPGGVGAFRQNSQLQIVCAQFQGSPRVTALIIVASNDPGQADALNNRLGALIGGIGTY